MAIRQIKLPRKKYTPLFTSKKKSPLRFLFEKFRFFEKSFIFGEPSSLHTASVESGLFKTSLGLTQSALNSRVKSIKNISTSFLNTLALETYSVQHYYKLMINQIIDKINFFYPTITNIVSLFFLALTLFHKVPFVHSRKDFLHLWVLRPIITYFLGFLISLTFGYFQIPYIWDFSNMPVLFQIGLLYLIFDLITYTIHYACHNNKTFFYIHRIHHQSEVLSWENGSQDTIYFEILIVAAIVIPAYLLKIPQINLVITLVFWKIMLAFSHYQKPFKFPFLEFLFISPEKHLIHHDEKNHPFNYALTLALWDNIFKWLYDKMNKSDPIDSSGARP